MIKNKKIISICILIIIMLFTGCSNNTSKTNYIESIKKKLDTYNKQAKNYKTSDFNSRDHIEDILGDIENIDTSTKIEKIQSKSDLLGSWKIYSLKNTKNDDEYILNELKDLLTKDEYAQIDFRFDIISETTSKVYLDDKYINNYSYNLKDNTIILTDSQDNSTIKLNINNDKLEYAYDKNYTLVFSKDVT